MKQPAVSSLDATGVLPPSAPAPSVPSPSAPSASDDDLYALAGKTVVRSVHLSRPASSLGKSSLLDEAYDAFCKLQQAGHVIDAEDFCARYPTVQHSLARLILAHRFIEENSHLVDEQVTGDWPVVGDAFAGFFLKRELGQGAFARVYQATEPALGNRLVAVKVSPRRTSEAATLGRISHPNIVPVFSVREDHRSGHSVICMPYLGCATLNNVLNHVHGQARRLEKASDILDSVQDPSLPDPPAAPALLRRGTYTDGVRWLALGIADALAFIHARGICHRDLKPSNVLVRPNGTPMLLDFNLSSDAQLPEARLGGTLLYMAPEQLLATNHNGPRDPKMLDARADLFSYGVIVYELLTGKHPFGPLPVKASTQDLRQFLLNKQKQGFRPIRTLNPNVDASLARVVESCLAHDAKDRPASAAIIVALLRRAMTPWRRAGRWLLNHKKTAAAVLLLLLTATGAGAYQAFIRPAAYIEQFNQGIQAYKDGDYPQALFLIEQAMLTHPDQAGVYFARGRIYQRMAERELDPQKAREQYVLAYNDFKQSENLAPSVKARASLGPCLHRMASPNQALACYKALNPEDVDAAAFHNNMGVAYLESRGLNDPTLEKAQDNLEKAIQLNPKQSAAHHNLALLFFEKANNLSSSDPDKQQDFLEKGIRRIREAVKIGPLTGELALDAARLCAVAARADRPRWVAPALGYLEKALDLGVNPRRLHNDRFLTTALDPEPEFQNLKQRPHALNPAAKAVRVIDLVRD